MHSSNISNEGESMYDLLEGVSTYYGFTWYQVKPGILIYNGTEYFLVKLKANKVRRLYHQNHNRTNKQITLPCGIEDIDNTIIQNCFHLQIWKDADCSNLKRTLVYIYHHGNARRVQETQRKAFLQTAFA